MNELQNPALTPLARSLRKNATKDERKLWYEFLRYLPVPFKRQKVIGVYIVDFYCASMRLVIELDGSQHCSQSGLKNDAVRDGVLHSLGLTVLRYSNLDISRNFRAVCEDILQHLEMPSD